MRPADVAVNVAAASEKKMWLLPSDSRIFHLSVSLNSGYPTKKVPIPTTAKRVIIVYLSTLFFVSLLGVNNIIFSITKTPNTISSSLSLVATYWSSQSSPILGTISKSPRLAPLYIKSTSTKGSTLMFES